MSIFGNNEEQDLRIEALEAHVRLLTEILQETQGDLAKGQIAFLALKAKVDGKVSADDVDPAIVKLNEDLAVAREKLEKSSSAASESWSELQGGVREAFSTLRSSVDKAYDRITKE